MTQEGLLLHVDGSRHDWLERRGPVLTLVGGIDDATSRVTGATFRMAEDAAGYFLMLAQTACRHGLAGAMYSDRHGIFLRESNRPPTLTEQLTGRRSLTQVGQMLDELGIRWIGARSSQAKGRVERLWGTFQDRLVSELCLAGAAMLEEANGVLAGYLPRYNRRFAVPAADPLPAWRPMPEGVTPESAFCFHYPRRVANDATVSWPGGPLQLLRHPDGRSWASRSVILQQRLDGSLWVSHEQAAYPVKPAPPDPGQLQAPAPLRACRGQTRPRPRAGPRPAE